ncbi:vWA domain-containing protein [Aestuariivirga sp.]|uniref:vWA domain-containing protein n=1 Tax=Aestuariivirga sp. TaxID=2650926 RepID=UPI003BA9C30A
MNAAAIERLAGFPRALREAGLAVDPASATQFLKAVSCVELLSSRDLRRAGRLTLTSKAEDFPLFDAVYDAWFSMQDVVLEIEAEGEEDIQKPALKSPSEQSFDLKEGDTHGENASADELVAQKLFSGVSTEDRAVLDAIRRMVLPSSATRQWQAAPSGSRIDIARTAAAARRTFGETLRLSLLNRPRVPRKLLLLIDVSGSMKLQSEIYIRTAHALTQGGARVETFCFSTRLTRATSALRHRSGEEALKRISAAVTGFDGGTRIGDSLEEFLNVSRHAALVRGAMTLVLSDGLECGSPDSIVGATRRLAALSHRLVWLTPLARDPRYIPATRAMSAILPHLDALTEASDLRSLHRSLQRLMWIDLGPRGRAASEWQLKGRGT